MKSPLEIRLKKDAKTLSVAFSAMDIYELEAELLRVESPSAEVQGHGPSEKRTVAGKKDVSITGIEPMGHYAIKIIFSDGHATGIYTWDYLKELGENKDRLWERYLQNLQKLNLTREKA